MAVDSGGQAFPRGGGKRKEVGFATQFFAPTDGITAADYFAAKAMQSLIDVLDANAAHGADGAYMDEIARVAYGYADAMVAEKLSRENK